MKMYKLIQTVIIAFFIQLIGWTTFPVQANSAVISDMNSALLTKTQNAEKTDTVTRTTLSPNVSGE